MNLVQKMLSSLLIPKKEEVLHNEFYLLFEKSEALILPGSQLNIAKEYFEHREYALCLDHIATQFYEFGLAIDDEFYHIVDRLAKTMLVPVSKYRYLESLILRA